jgi:DNA-binding transcriptional LysR family regulator
MNLELHHLRHFIAVAEELHFGRAAARLGMAQPPLSQSIRRAEAALGFALFEREKRAVRLSAAGRSLLEEARQIVLRVDLAIQIARRTAAGDTARLRIGCMPWSLLPALPQAIRAFRKRWPGAEVRIYERSTRQQLDSLRDGSLDLGIIAWPAPDAAGLAMRKIVHAHSMAAVPARWDIGRRRSIHFAELAPYPFIMFPKSWNEEFLARFHALCAKAGFVANVTQEAAQPYTMLTMVANELGVTLLQSTARHLKVQGVRFVPISDMPSSFGHDIAIAWVKANESRALAAFVDSFEQAALAA